MLNLRRGEQVAALSAALLFVIAIVWALFSDSPSLFVTGLGEQNFERSFTADPVLAEFSPDPIVWEQPIPQGGINWIFDLFTPPVIYYDEETGTFTVTPPFPDSGPVEETFELELVEISPVPFRYQLVSYAGARGNYVLTLEDLETGKDIFCSPHENLTEQRLRILDFTEKRIVAESSLEGSTEAFDLIGEAIIQEEDTGTRYSLFLNQITYVDKPAAQFLSRNGETLFLSVGESWASSGANYTIKEINLNEESASVEKTYPDVDDRVFKMLQISNRFNTSDLSNRNSRPSDSAPGTF